MQKPPSPSYADWTPQQARAAFRAGLAIQTSPFCHGYAQANLIIVPQAQAFDVLLFAQRNPKPCPLLGVLEAGQTTGPQLVGGNICTDVPRYTVYENGQKVDEPGDISALWRDDFVTFIIGCSFTFESALMGAGINLAHIDQGVNVPMYKTRRRCVAAGSMDGPLVVSMRPIPAHQVADAVRITSRYPAVHGAPVHVGNPQELGIADLQQPDFGEAVTIPAGHIPVFWACGVTPQAAIMETRPAIAIGHAPGHMLITDMPDSHYLIP